MKRVTLFGLVLLVIGLSRVMAVTGLGPGYYQSTNTSIVLSGSWSTVTYAPSYGGAYSQTSSGAARTTFYTLSTVGRVGIYYHRGTQSGVLNADVNGVNYLSTNTYSATSLFNQYVEFNLPAASNTVDLYLSGSTYLNIAAIQLLEPNPSVITAVVVFPTHTPTPTLTLTLTPTTGPSPTPTATATPTPNTSTTYYSDGGDVVVSREVRPGDVAIVGLLVIVVGILMSQVIFKVLEIKSFSNKPGGSE